MCRDSEHLQGKKSCRSTNTLFRNPASNDTIASPSLIATCYLVTDMIVDAINTFYSIFVK